jgi:hypothetical protein
MKYSTTIFSLVLCALMLAAVTTQAQKATSKDKERKEKEESKKWKQKMKATKPLEFKDMMNQRAELVGENEGLKRQLTNMGKVVSDKDAEIDALRKELDSVKAGPAPAQVRAEGNEIQGGGHSTEFAQGTWFRVQVGVYSKLDISKFKDNNKNFSVEQDSDGSYKYTLGHFRDYWEADEFKKYMRKLGVRDAWIVAYKDNQRVNIKDVMDSKPAESSEPAQEAVTSTQEGEGNN